MYFCLLIMVVAAVDVSAQNTRTLKRQIDQYYSLSRYWDAKPLLETYCADKPNDEDARLKLAITQYHTNDLPSAINSFEFLVENQKSPSEELNLWLAKCYHEAHQFKKAIELYKEILRSSEATDPILRNHITGDIKRCAVGLRYRVPDDEVFVENMGGEVNSRFDDFIPVESPNHNSRVYFSSVRSVRVSDDFDTQGKLKGTTRQQDCDMFATEIINGAWSAAVPLNIRLNTGQHEILQDFSEDGMIAFFKKSRTLADGPVYVDTFDLEEFESMGNMWVGAPIGSEESIRGLYFFSDSVLFFSSNRAGGLGGYDIYLSVLRNGNWIDAVNLGSDINSQFDEVSPFLAQNGRKLYFSSNNYSSMGGFDVFSIDFDDKSQQWGDLTNLGQPTNSAGNELYFRLGSNGLSSYFASDRKSGKGGLDIYSAYYRSPRKEQLARSTPLVFYQVRDYQLFAETYVDQNPKNSNDGTRSVSKVVSIPTLFFRDNDQVLTPQNGDKLEMLAGFLKTYPHVTIDILSHSDINPATGFDLFVSIKRAEQVSDFLQSKGIQSSRISVKGLSGNYPLARTEIDGRINEAAVWYNRRLDFIVHNQHQLPFEIKYDLPEISEPLSSPAYQQFMEQRRGLVFSIQFAELDQMYKGDLSIFGRHTSIVKKSGSDRYLYFTGLFKSFEDALANLSKVKQMGFNHAEVIPFIDGVLLSKGDISPSLFEQYPDLKNYVLYLE